MVPIAHVFSHRELARRIREKFHEGLALVGPSAKKLGDALGPGEDMIEAWGRADATTNVPLWILAHPALPKELRAWLVSTCDNLYVSARSGVSIPSAEDQTNVVNGVLGRLLIAMSSAMIDRRWSPDEAREALPIALATMRHIETLVTTLRAVLEGPAPSNDSNVRDLAAARGGV